MLIIKTAFQISQPKFSLQLQKDTKPTKDILKGSLGEYSDPFKVQGKSVPVGEERGRCQMLISNLFKLVSKFNVKLLIMCGETVHYGKY